MGLRWLLTHFFHLCLQTQMENDLLRSDALFCVLTSNCGHPPSPASRPLHVPLLLCGTALPPLLIPPHPWGFCSDTIVSRKPFWTLPPSPHATSVLQALPVCLQRNLCSIRAEPLPHLPRRVVLLPRVTSREGRSVPTCAQRNLGRSSLLAISRGTFFE